MAKVLHHIAFLSIIAKSCGLTVKATQLHAICWKTIEKTHGDGVFHYKMKSRKRSTKSMLSL